MVYFYKLEAWGQTVLPDRSTLNCKKLGENEKKKLEKKFGKKKLKIQVRHFWVILT